MNMHTDQADMRVNTLIKTMLRINTLMVRINTMIKPIC